MLECPALGGGEGGNTEGARRSAVASFFQDVEGAKHRGFCATDDTIKSEVEGKGRVGGCWERYSAVCVWFCVYVVVVTVVYL